MPTPPAPLAPGSLVTGRYRLLRQVGDARSTLWEAHDDILARQVAIRSLPAGSGTDAVLDAARRAGVVPHRTLTRAYDVVDEPDLRLVVREWVDGEPLDAVVAEGPLSPDRAMAVIGAVADAVSAAATYGVHHSRLHPGHVLLTPEGDVRVTDAATAAAIAGAPPGDDADDVRALGALLYYALTGRWPGDNAGAAADLPPAPTEEGRLCSPRQVRAGVPRDLDRLVTDCLLTNPGTPASAAEVASRLTMLRHSGEPTQVIMPVVEADPVPARRTRVPILVAAGLAVVLLGYIVVVSLTGAGGVGTPFDLLRHNAATTSTSASPSPGTTSSSPSPSGAPLGTYPLTSANSFDPFGDKSEEQSHAKFAIDDSMTTFWYTESYRQANLGGLKPGVGLLIDAGTAVAPSQVTVSFLTPGTSFDIRSADSPATTLDPYTLQGSTVATSTTASVPITDKTPHRYWLLWITHLPGSGTDFHSSVTNIALDH